MSLPLFPGEDEELSEPLGHRSVRGTAAVLTAQILKMAILFISQLVLARLLDPGDFGLVAMVTPIWAFVLIFADLGLAQAIVQRPNITEPQLSALFWIVSAITALLSVIMALTAPLLAWLYGDARVAEIVVCLASLILVSGLSMVPMALLNRRMKFGLLSIIDIICAGIGVGVGLILAWLGFGYWALVYAQAANAVSSLALSWICSGWGPSMRFREPEVWPMLHFGADISGVKLAVYITGSIDNILIGAVAGNVALGLYDRAYRLVVVPLTQLVLPFGQVIVPLLSRLLHSHDSYRQAYLMVLQALLLIIVPASIFGALMAGPVIAVLLGPRWTAADPVFAWVCFGSLASPIYTSVGWLFVTQGRTREQLWYTGITSAITICAVLVGLWWGVVGVACSTALSFVLLQTPLLCWAVTRRGAVDLRSLIAALVPYGLAGMFSLAVLLSCKYLFLGRDVGTLALLTGITYISALSALTCFSSSRQFLYRLWKLRTAFLSGPGLVSVKE